jgi:hypothetical protein
MRYWLATPSGSAYVGPVRQIFVASTLQNGDVEDPITHLPIHWTWQSRAVAGTAGIITGIDAFYVTMLHERRHIKQILDSEQLPYWRKNGPARDGAANAGWSWNTPSSSPHYNHWAVGPDGVFGTADDVDLDPPPRTDLGKVPDGLDLTGGYSSVEAQAQSVETVPDNTMARLDWGHPGKNHKTINKAND